MSWLYQLVHLQQKYRKVWQMYQNLQKKRFLSTENISPNLKVIDTPVSKKKKFASCEDEIFFDIIRLILSWGHGPEYISSAYIQKICYKMISNDIKIPDIQYFSTTILKKSENAYF